MPHLFIKAPPGVSTFPIDVNFDTSGVGSLALHYYQASGLANLSPIFFSIENQPTTQLFGNPISSHSYPLPVSTFPDCAFQFSKPVVICEGDNLWNGAHRLDIRLRDQFGNPLVFGEFFIMLEVQVRDPFMPRHQPPHDFKQYKEATQATSRNMLPLPDAFFSHTF